jgi:hypothetical protein
MKKFTFHTSRVKGSARSYTKTEDRLTQEEINLLTGNIVNEFNKLPQASKMMFMHYLNQALKYDIQEERSGDSSLSEPEVAEGQGQAATEIQDKEGN